MLSVADLEVKTSSQKQGFEINKYFEIESNSFVPTKTYSINHKLKSKHAELESRPHIQFWCKKYAHI